MCLTMRFKSEVEKKMIAKLPDGLITVYKVVNKTGKYYYPVLFGVTFKTGMNKADTSVNIEISRTLQVDNKYESGYHSYRALWGTQCWAKCSWRRRVKMKIRKKWITAIGKQAGAVVYVTNRIISPSLKDKSALVENAKMLKKT